MRRARNRSVAGRQYDLTVTRRTSTVAAITVAALVAIGVISAITIQSSYDSNVGTERSKLEATAQVTAQLIAQQMNGVTDLEQAILEQRRFVTAIGSGDPARFDTVQLQAVLDQLQRLRPEFQFAAVADAGGTTRATAPADHTVIGRNFAFRDWYRGVMRTGHTYVSTAYVSAIKGAPLVVAIATPIRIPAGGAATSAAPSTGPVVGVLFIGYKIGSVQAFADRLAGLERINLQLTDQAGVVMAQQGGISGHLTSVAGAQDVAAALAGHVTVLTTSQAIDAAVPVPGLGWTVSASTPLAATAAAAQRSTSALIAAGLLIVLGLAGVALVITIGRLERANAGHAASEIELRTVQQALTEAIQVFDRDGRLVSRNAGAERIFAVNDSDRTPNAFDSPWELLREDGSAMPLEERPVSMAVRTGEPSEQVVVGIRSRVQQDVKWLSVSTMPIRDAQEQLSGFVCCSRDISERMQTIRELDVITRGSQLLSSSLDPEDVMQALTTSAAHLCSAPGEPTRRAQIFVIDGATMTLTGEYDPHGPVKFDGTVFAVAEHPYIQQVLATGEAVNALVEYDRCGPGVADLMRRVEIKNCVWVPLRRPGRTFAVLAVAGRQHALINPAQLERLKTLCTIAELALSNAEAHERAAQLARTDALTGVGNRRALDDQLAHLPRTRFAIVAVDVDDLKKVNDAHGHDVGDQLLIRVAQALAEEVRPGDLLARAGGDEFVAVLVDCDAEGAVALGKRLTRAAARLHFAWGTPSISVGSAAGQPGDAPHVVAKAADEALYAAKSASQGRSTDAGVDTGVATATVEAGTGPART